MQQAIGLDLNSCPDMSSLRLPSHGGLTSLLHFMFLVGQLKRVKRSGWTYYKVKDGESDADHMYRMSLLALLFNKEDDDVDQDKLVKLAIIHDIGESLIGDLTPLDGVSKDEKRSREGEAVNWLNLLLSAGAGGAGDYLTSLPLHDLWWEYEHGVTPESKVAHELDKFEMLLQAFEYEMLGDRVGELEAFFTSYRGIFSHPKILSWMEELDRLREEART